MNICIRLSNVANAALTRTLKKFTLYKRRPRAFERLDPLEYARLSAAKGGPN